MADHLSTVQLEVLVSAESSCVSRTRDASGRWDSWRMDHDPSRAVTSQINGLAVLRLIRVERADDDLELVALNQGGANALAEYRRVLDA
jgi:hypothetical protein